MGIDAAISLLLALIENLQRVSGVIAQAQADGRTHLTESEWTGILASADAARAALAPPAPSAAPGPVPADQPMPEGT